jgi:predicted nuclease of predicted toxin-antitoxin system
MKILANENIPLASVKYLLSVNVDLVWIGNDYSGISDEEVMEIAISQNRTIVTFDRDYSELIFKYGYKPQAGVIYLRFDEYTPVFAGELIHKIIGLEELDFERRLTVIDKRGIRQRKY